MRTLPKFHDLTRLRATVCLNASPELLPMLLESCPNLKHLTLVTILALNFSVSKFFFIWSVPLDLTSVRFFVFAGIVYRSSSGIDNWTLHCDAASLFVIVS